MDRDLTQSHSLSKFIVEYVPIINAVCRRFGVSVAEVMSETKEFRVVDARRDLAEKLLLSGLTYAEIGQVINRDRRSVELLLTRKRKREAHPNVKHHEVNPDPAIRDDSKRIWRDHCEAGSKALLRAIFATGKIYRPMSAQEIEHAKNWAVSGQHINVEEKGWMTGAPEPWSGQWRLPL